MQLTEAGGLSSTAVCRSAVLGPEGRLEPGLENLVGFHNNPGSLKILDSSVVCLSFLLVYVFENCSNITN